MLSSLKSLTTSSAIKSAYSINEETGFMAGAWLVQDATKKSTKQEYSILTFSKKTLEQPLQRSSSSLRQSFDTIYAQLKAEAATLARLRHPAMLEVVESIEESRNTIIFVTERVTACLSSLVADDDSGSFSSRTRRGDSTRLDEIEIQKGLLQVTIGLEFLQGVAQIVHGNLVPAAVFINAKGDWKLSGFSFALAMKESPRHTSPEYDDRLPQSVQRNLDYAAPEYVIDETIDPLNDMFALGCLICALVSSKHKSIIQCNQNMHLYRKAVDNIDIGSVQGIPPYLKDVLPQLLTRRPANRLSASAFQSSPFFDNILMNSIRFLDAFPEKTASERQSFMKGLQSVIPQFPPRVLTKKILPGLLDQFQDHALLPLILPNVFIIAEGMTQKVFSEAVLPKLRPIFKVADSPGSLMFLLEKMSFLKQKITALELKEDGMTLIYTALTGDVQYLQEKALKVSAEVVKDLDLVTIKTALFPKIAEVFTHTTMLGIKVTSLETFNDMVIHNLDKYTITEKLLPLIKGIKTKEPAVGMAALELSKSCGMKIDHENIAMDILPQLWSMSLGPLLSQRQFREFMSVIKELSKKVEVEQSRKLSDSGAPTGNIESTNARSGNLMESGPVEEVSFENLVLGGKAKSSANGMNHMTMKAATPSVAQGSFDWSTPALPPTVTSTSNSQAGGGGGGGATALRPQGLSNYPALTPDATGAGKLSRGASYNTQTTAMSSAVPLPSAGIDWSSATQKTTYTSAQIPGSSQFGWSTPPVPPPQQVSAMPFVNKQTNFPTLSPPPPTTKYPAAQTNQRKGLDAYQSLL